MKKLVVGILAHVDAGKTTLSEGMLYLRGCIRKLGRVDHQDAFLDMEQLERERGITIFSKQAILPLGQQEITLLDTPGHVDFSTEMERTLQVLDYAILVVSGSDGVQGHTRTLWQLLERYGIPVFLFVNKMDLDGTEEDTLQQSLCGELSAHCVDFSKPQPDIEENAALSDEQALDEYMEKGTLKKETIAGLIARRRLFPCYYGSALKLQGVEELLQGLDMYTQAPVYPEPFSARVYKIGRDPQGVRLTYLKVTGGVLHVRDQLSGSQKGKNWEEKVGQIRVYSGARYQTLEEAEAGTVCAVTGLSMTRPGDGLGEQNAAAEPVLEPVLTYRLLLPEGWDPHTALRQLSQLEEEDPQLHLFWQEQLQEIQIQLMGEVQLEILRRVIEERFGKVVDFDTGKIVYRETIANCVEGVGHFEPLRHYAEVHLLLEPLPAGSGLQFDSICSEDQLDRSWQRLILTHLMEKTHRGVLTGSPLTDVRITLASGRAHLKHTEGGDFRQATYRAVRQGLMQAENILLEPWYGFRLEVPQEQVGRALADLQYMGAEYAPVETGEGRALLTGEGPVSMLNGYWKEVAAYTKGQGHLFCTLAGYRPCLRQEEIVEEMGYDPQRDLENPADSVFCAHGAGFTVKWDQVPEYMHLESCFRKEKTEVDAPETIVRTGGKKISSFEQDRQLQEIFERTYGPVRQYRPPRPVPQVHTPQATVRRSTEPVGATTRTEYLLVDGYNIIFAWEELKEIAREQIDAARQTLMDLLCNYQGFRKCRLILVFDAYKVARQREEVIRYQNIDVVYTREAETADTYIERVSYQLGKQNRVRVATSDRMEQLIILGHGAIRVSAEAFHQEVEQTSGEISALIAENNRRLPRLNPVQWETQKEK